MKKIKPLSNKLLTIFILRGKHLKHSVHFMHAKIKENLNIREKKIFHFLQKLFIQIITSMPLNSAVVLQPRHFKAPFKLDYIT